MAIIETPISWPDGILSKDRSAPHENRAFIYHRTSSTVTFIGKPIPRPDGFLSKDNRISSIVAFIGNPIAWPDGFMSRDRQSRWAELDDRFQ